MTTVGILNHVQLERQLMDFATKQGNAMLGVISKATAYTLSAPSPKAISILRKRMEEKGCPKGTVDVAFSIAKLIAPRIENAVKGHANHVDAMGEVEAQIVTMKGDNSWKDFKALLQGKATGDAPQVAAAAPVTQSGDAVVVEDVEHSEPLSPVADTLFDRAMANMANWSDAQLGAVFDLLMEISSVESLDAMAEAIVSERLAREAVVEMLEAA